MLCACRLLGPNTAADFLQLTHSIPQASVPLRTHILANEDLRIISRPDEDLFEELFQVVLLLDFLPPSLRSLTSAAPLSGLSLTPACLHTCLSPCPPIFIGQAAVCFACSCLFLVVVYKGACVDVAVFSLGLATVFHSCQ